MWIDPTEYAEELTEAVLILDRSRIHTMIYNHQLCLIPRSLWPWAVRSISDWKNEYHPECGDCRDDARGDLGHLRDRLSGIPAGRPSR